MTEIWIAVCHLWPVLIVVAAVLAVMLFITVTDPYPDYGDDEERDGRGTNDW